MYKDYHIHTTVSDASIIPEALFPAARKLGLRELSITDHDAIGAYFHFHPDLFALARSYGLRLIAGMELDAEYQGVEVHILGYDFDLHNRELQEYLRDIQSLRRERVRQQLIGVNRALGEEVIREADVFLPERDTMMKPHLVHALLDRGLFSEYREASRWLSANAPSDIVVPKPTATRIIELILQAGGRPILAHPGFYVREHGLPLHGMLEAMKGVGLEGVEVEYRYRGSSVFPDVEDERRMIEEVRTAAEALDLGSTCGSDAHSIEELENYHG